MKETREEIEAAHQQYCGIDGIIRQCTVESEEMRSPETDNVASQRFQASLLLRTRGLHAQNFQQA
jgi:hypothetical protein